KEKKQAAVKNQNFELAASYRDRQTTLERQLETLQQQWTDGDGGHRETVTDTDVADVVSTMTGVPVQRMAESEGIRLRNMASKLK
ncbi:UvrB/UvrC motif-containing protein, partial [Salmonella enterica]|uniref:UvrB/UvrC motif-containing protein n=1 Tax=Salmonella enterica TaxID=28901 RepID=UPI003CF029C9